MRKPGRSDGMRRATVQDVARAANVSTATVSRALRFPEQVSPQLGSRVAEAVAKLGYVPNASGRALSTLRTGMVAIVVSDVERYARVVSAALKRLGAFGLAVRIEECESCGVANLVERLVQEDVEGVFLVGPRWDQVCGDGLVSRRVAHVAAGADLCGWPGVHIDMLAAADTALGHLAAFGHRRVAVIGDEHDALIDGWLTTVATTGARFGIAMTRFASPVEWMMAGDRATAVMCGSDSVSTDLVRSLRARGLKVPGDVSCVGWGDHPWAARANPALTTLRLPHREIGERLIEALFAARTGTAVKTWRVVPKLVIRQSTGRADVPRGTSPYGFT